MASLTKDQICHLQEIYLRRIAVSHENRWHITHYSGGLSFDGPATVITGNITKEGYPEIVIRPQKEEDAVFISHAPTDIDYLFQVIGYLTMTANGQSFNAEEFKDF